MSQENVEVVRTIVDAIDRRDARSWAAIVAPQFEFGSAFVGVEGRSYRGPESGGQYFADLADAFDSFKLDIEDSLDVRDGRVLTTIRVLGRGKASGADFDTHIWSVNGVRDGKIVSGQTYFATGPRSRGAAEVGDVARQHVGRFAASAPRGAASSSNSFGRRRRECVDLGAWTASVCWGWLDRS